MPEGPELYLASRFVNNVCVGRVFTGKVIKSPVHKSDEVPFESKEYTISADARGKEMQLILAELEEDKPKSKAKKKKGDLKQSRILFRFGMSGKFEFTTIPEIHKHSHLQFFTNDDPPMVLSHVDVRRFGRWEVNADWSKQRGPDPMFQYQDFRSNVVSNIKRPAFERPICEVLLNQKYFNGIGNYLRAEILYRMGIAPFEKARNVLEGLSEEPPDVKVKVKGRDLKIKVEEPAVDILHLCHIVPLEVINLGGGGYDPEGRPADYSKFNTWLQCYYQEGMKNLMDHNKRTIWFAGPAGPMTPKELKSRSPVKRKNKETISDQEGTAPSRKKKVTKATVTPKSKDKTKKTPSSRRKTNSKQVSPPKPSRKQKKIEPQAKKSLALTKTIPEITPIQRRSTRRVTAITNGVQIQTPQRKKSASKKKATTSLKELTSSKKKTTKR
ncbi:endonuclease 8-like 1 [Asterias amurensis]|uniref:endonuclease 8-like 1 n=1 Tax=Asterias amurensis TaxID=7602 RepID=UPI003AB7306C